MKRLLGILLLVTLVLVSCAKPAPPPAPSPSPAAKPAAPAAAPASPKPPAAAPSPAAPKPPAPVAQPEVKIDILGSKLGASVYVLAYALSDLINKNSPWLRATTVETAGFLENAQVLAQEPAKRKATVIASDTAVNYQATVGERPFTKPYTSLKLISRLSDMAMGLASRDAKIKTPMDLVGKRVAFGTPTAQYYQHQSRILRYGVGIWDKMTVQDLHFDAAKEALLDGRVDVVAVGGSITEPGATASQPKTVSRNPATQELSDRLKLYGVDLDKAAVEKARKETGYPLAWVQIPAGYLGATQPQPMGGYILRMAWAADADLDEKVVYEMARVSYENAKKFGEYHADGKGITADSIAMVAGTTEADFHPGAVKFYKERGLKIGG